MLTGSEVNDCSSIVAWVFSNFLLIQSVNGESIVHFFSTIVLITCIKINMKV